MGFTDERGNSLINEEHKVRIALSERALTTLAEDMEIFGVSKVATFINTVFYNFRETATASVSSFLEQKKLELDQTLAIDNLDSTSKQIVLEQLLKEEESVILKQIEQYNTGKSITKLYHINMENIDILENDCNEDKYYSRPGAYIRSIIEEYCSLPFIKRERIFRKPVYDLIQDACNQKRLLKVKADYYGKEETFIVYPYKILPEPFHTQSYLVCYSRRENESDKDKIVASFTMARIRMPHMYQKTFYLNQQEINHLEDCITNHSPAYLVGKPELIHVRLTEKGKRSYRSRLYSRPEKVEELSSDDIYVFECTQQQIFNYFFSFGAEAEIISPQGLRERFLNTHKRALETYGE